MSTNFFRDCCEQPFGGTSHCDDVLLAAIACMHEERHLFEHPLNSLDIIVFGLFLLYLPHFLPTVDSFHVHVISEKTKFCHCASLSWYLAALGWLTELLT